MIGEILIEFLITVAEMIIDGKGNRIATLLVCLFCGSLLILTLIIMVTSWEPIRSKLGGWESFRSFWALRSVYVCTA